MVDPHQRFAGAFWKGNLQANRSTVRGMPLGTIVPEINQEKRWQEEGKGAGTRGWRGKLIPASPNPATRPAALLCFLTF